MKRVSAYLKIFCVATATLALAHIAVAAEQHVMSIEINKGQMVKLDRPAASVVISDPGTADVQVVSPKLLFVRGKKVGETSFFAIDGEDNSIYSATVDVTHDISQLERAIKTVAPNADVQFKTVDGGLVMHGYADTVDESEKIRNIASAIVGDKDKMINMIQTAGSDQVMLKVKIVEMSRNDTKKLGINLQNVTSNGNFAFQLLQGSDILFHTADPNTLAYNTPGSVLSRTGTDTNIYAKYKSLNGLIDALETNGMAHVLAEPSLTTTSGKQASFLAGGQFPIPAVQPGGGGSTITIQYQPFGVSLNFTPVVMSKNRISITVAPEVSTLDFNNPIQVSGITYPILDTRKASSVVELGSGDSFMLAGLLQNQTVNNINKMPGLGDLPILGALFRSTQFQNNQTELVILVTPYIVRPVAENGKLQTPIDGYKAPTDVERLFQGKLYEQQPLDRSKKPKESAADAPKLHGEGGFILE